MGRRKNGLKGKGTLIAVVAALGLGAWAYFGERGPVLESGQEPPVSSLVGMQADKVTRVELKGDGPPLVVARQGEHVVLLATGVHGPCVHRRIRWETGSCRGGAHRAVLADEPRAWDVHVHRSDQSFSMVCLERSIRGDGMDLV